MKTTMHTIVVQGLTKSFGDNAVLRASTSASRAGKSSC